MRLTPERMERAAGILVLVVVVLVMGAFVLHLKEKGTFERKIHIHAYNGNAAGIAAGSGIKLLGLQIGEVTGLVFDEDRARQRDPKPIRVDIAIQGTMAPFVRKDFQLTVPATSVITAGFVAGVLELKDPDGEDCKAPAIEEADELRFADAGKAIDEYAKDFGDWWENHKDGFEALLQNVEATVADVSNPERPLQRTLANVEEITARLKSGDESVPHLMLRINGILDALQEGDGAAGALLSDAEVREDIVEALHQVRGMLESDIPTMVSALVNVVENDLPPILETAKDLAGDVQTLTGVLADRPERITQLLDDVHEVLQQVRDALRVVLPILQEDAPSMVIQVQQTLDDAQAALDGVNGVLHPFRGEPVEEVPPELRQPRMGERP